jgi:D-lactate dehydrogenase
MSRLIPNTSNTVICFVNDSLDSNGIKALKENNVDLIALRCTGFNNVDLK